MCVPNTIHTPALLRFISVDPILHGMKNVANHLFPVRITQLYYHAARLLVWCGILTLPVSSVFAGETSINADELEILTKSPEMGPQRPKPEDEDKLKNWHWGIYTDASYIRNFNNPGNHEWRKRATTRLQNDFELNMASAYIRKDSVISSPWGGELALQTGTDTKGFAFLQGERAIPHSDWLSRINRANITYLAPVGNGLLLTAGIFNSVIGYEDFFAINNPNYSRSWVAENVPFLMMGVKARYPINDKFTVAFMMVNGYYHLSYTTPKPSYVGKIIYKPQPNLAFTQILYGGPEQHANTGLDYYRFYSNSFFEYRGTRWLFGGTFDVGTERVAVMPVTFPSHDRALVMGGSVVGRWNYDDKWSIAVRPEFYWDRDGRWTGSPFFVKALTTTLERKFSLDRMDMVFRAEHRWDESTGQGGGFFRGRELAPDVFALTPTQHTLFFSVMWRYDSR